MKRAKRAVTPATRLVQRKEKSPPLSKEIVSENPPPAPAGGGRKPQPPEPTQVELSQVPPILLEGDEPQRTPETGLAHKFASGPRVAAPAPRASQPELPESYGTGRLLLAARDPNCLYAHWDLTTEQQQQHESLSAQKQLQLRIHQESLSGPIISEIQVPPQSHHSFISIDAPNAKRFSGELGYYTAEGSWTTVARAATTAAASAAPRLSEPVRFTTLSFGPEAPSSGKPTAPLQNIQSNAGTTVTEPALLRSFPLAKPLTAVSTQGEINETPSIVPLEELQDWLEVPDDQTMFEEFGDVAQEQVLSGTTASTQPVSGPVGQWTAAQERALAELIGWSVMHSGSLGSAGIEELVRGIQRAEAPQPSEISSKGLPLGQAELFSGGLAGLPSAGQGFWFNVNAELVIYGATEPGATVTFGGRPIVLRPDGTFSYRFALPDGTYHLPASAHSKRGEELSVALEFYRGTTYSEGVGKHPQDPALKAPAVDNIT